jgi:DNA-binding NtrC family response regulator
VVSDFSMSGMNGAQLLAEVTRLYPDTLRIIVSGQTMNRAMQAGLRRGEIHHYFEKQHSHGAMRACIRDWLTAARQQK